MVCLEPEERDLNLLQQWEITPLPAIHIQHKSDVVEEKDNLLLWTNDEHYNTIDHLAVQLPVGTGGYKTPKGNRDFIGAWRQFEAPVISISIIRIVFAVINSHR